MASSVPPKKNTAYTFDAVLIATATGAVKTGPTLAAGDIKVMIDGGASANIGTLPSEAPAGSGLLAVALTAAEMNGDRITVLFRDAAGAEWNDLHCVIETAGQTQDNIYARIGAPAGASISADIAALITGTIGLDAILSQLRRIVGVFKKSQNS